MKRICLINIWIGKLPESFPLFLRSAQLNPSVDFYLVTDQELGVEISNVHLVRSDLVSVKQAFEEELQMKIKLEHAYKLCDYKPIWRVAISSDIKDYDFWGVIDLDIILGDIRRFVTDDILERHNKIFDAGFLLLFRNNDEVNRMYRKSQLKENMAYPYKRAFRTNYACYFDEYMGMSILGWQYMDVFRDQLTEDMIQDFDWKRLDFASYITKETFVFRWENGRLYRYLTDKCGVILDGQEPKELLLAHIQKRSMEIKVPMKELEDIKSFWIYPNCFDTQKPTQALYDKQKLEEYAEFIRQRDKKKKWDNLKRYGVLDYIPHYIISKRIKKFIVNVKKFY